MQHTSLEMIGKLVSFDTVSSKSNMELIHFVRDYFTAHNIQSTIIPDDTGTKANLYATVGPNIEGGIVLSGHSDVVPVEGQPWDTDPFQVVEKNGKLFGRGTCDMKGFVGTCLAALPKMQAADLKYPIHFAISCDEEIGCSGVIPMIEAFDRELPKPRAVIVGEPSMMKIVNGHKGGIGFKTTVTGKDGHSSLPQYGVSAILIAARLISFLEDIEQEYKANSAPDCPFNPPYSTLNMGVISGGTALNIIARQCEFTWGIRSLPQDDPMDIFEKFNAYADKLLEKAHKITTEVTITTETGFNVPGLKPEPEAIAEEFCAALLGANSTDVVSYGTEAGWFQSIGYSTIVCGPGSIEQAHQPNEFIEVSQVSACETFIDKLIDSLAD